MKALDEKGRCCGRKPLVYKRDHTMFCGRCMTYYSLDTGREINRDEITEGGIRVISSRMVGIRTSQL